MGRCRSNAVPSGGKRLWEMTMLSSRIVGLGKADIRQLGKLVTDRKPA